MASSDAIADPTEPAVAGLEMAGPSTIAAGTGSVLSLAARNAQGTVTIDYQGGKLLTFSGASLAPDGTRPTVVDQAGSSIASGSPATVMFTPRR